MVASSQPLSLDLRHRAHRTLVLRDLLHCLALAAPTEDGAPAQPLRLELEDPMVQAYAQAWCDLFTMFGALQSEGEQFTVVSPQAGYFLRLLRALSTAPGPLVRDWHAEGVSNDAAAALDTGVNLLAALERRRMLLQSAAKPLRETRAALGVIARRAATACEVLLVWDAAAGAWQLPGGRSERRDSSLRATLLRELAEELVCGPLNEGTDVQITALGAPAERTRWSPTYGLHTRTQFQLFMVRWYTALPTLPDYTRWLNEPELRAERTSDGQPIAAEPLVQFLDAAAVSLDMLLDTAADIELEKSA